MNFAVVPEPDFVDRKVASINNSVRVFLANRHKEKLLSEIANISDVVAAHVRAGVKPGDGIFAILFKKTSDLIDNYCQTANIDKAHVVSDLPIYSKLFKLTHPEIKPALRIFIAMLIGFISGFCLHLIIHFI